MAAKDAGAERTDDLIYDWNTADGAAARDCTEVALIRQPLAASRPGKRSGKRRARPQEPLPDASPELVEALTRWRLNEARQRAAPAFTILNNATLQRLAALRPDNEEKLLEIKGIGPALARRHGAAILEIIARQSDGTSPDPRAALQGRCKPELFP